MRQVPRILAALVSDGRWRRSLALAVAFAIGCGLLSWWQFARREESSQANALIAANTAADPAPLKDLLPGLDDDRPDLEWRTVRVTGTYLTAEQLLVRNRVVDDRPGFEVLTPLLTGDGAVFVVDRGWLPIGRAQDLPDDVPAPPTGQVTVDARLRGGEPARPGGASPPGQIRSIDLPAVAVALDLPTYTGAYGQAVAESPAPVGTPLRSAPTAIGVDEGTHLSYAVQWILFALLGFFGLAWSVRRELLDRGDPVIAEAEERRVSRRGRTPTDEEVEDAASV